jgi:Epoxide hydrolase N terminus
MRDDETSEQINHDRRRVLGTTTIGIAAAGTVGLLPVHPVSAADDTIRPFRISVSEEQLVDLRRRIAATRWPDRETVADESQGVQLAALKSHATGERITTGAKPRRSSMLCRSSSPRLMGSTFISFMFVRSMKMPCR